MCLPGTVQAVREQAEREGPPRLTRRAALAGSGAAALGALLPGAAAAHPPGDGHGHPHHRPRGRVQDLTWTFRAGFPMYTGAPPVRRTANTIAANGFYSQEWTFGEHSGTHMDAPGHFVEGGRRVPQITPEELFAPIAVIDIRRRAARDPDTVVTPDDLLAYERRYGRIPPRAAVFMDSGWGARVGDPVAYKNADASGTFHFPGWSADAVTWLLEHRDVASVGVDTLSIDPGNAPVFVAHVALLGADRYGLENLAHLEQVPRSGARGIVGVIPWEEGSGGPCRVFARW